jgi:hypothetical protein
MGFPIVPKGGGGNDEREASRSLDSWWDNRSSFIRFLHMSETETVMMTKKRLMVGMAVVMWIVPIFLVLVMQ